MGAREGLCESAWVSASVSWELLGLFPAGFPSVSRNREAYQSIDQQDGSSSSANPFNQAQDSKDGVRTYWEQGLLGSGEGSGTMDAARQCRLPVCERGPTLSGLVEVTYWGFCYPCFISVSAFACYGENLDQWDQSRVLIIVSTLCSGYVLRFKNTDFIKLFKFAAALCSPFCFNCYSFTANV